MKRICFLLVLFCAAFVDLSAQKVISGKVTDKKGQPIPGVRVKSNRTTEFTVTEPDGTFRLETKYSTRKLRVDYVGFQPKKLKASPDMDIRLKKTNLWNRKPSKMQWFVNLQAAVDPIVNVPPVFGIMFGQAKGFGWYAKSICNPGGYVSDFDVENFYFPNHSVISSDYLWKTGKVKFSFYSISGGFVCRLGCALHLYGGLGCAGGWVHYELSGGKTLRSNYSDQPMMAESGFMLRLGRVNVNAGMMLMNEFDDPLFMCNFGIGINL